MKIIKPGLANDNLADRLTTADISQIEALAEKHCDGLLRALLIDIDRDHNTRGTPKRMAKMFVREIFAGRFQPAPCVTDFPNAKNLDEIVVIGPVAVRSTCAHHFCPIEGKAWVGMIPSKRVIGLSKFSRLTEWIMSRPQIQEEATVQLADALEKAIRPRALGVVVTARHSCMSWRGVREPASQATTSVMRGLFRTKPEAKAEFLSLIGRFQCE